jgi:hypothetical protein
MEWVVNDATLPFYLRELPSIHCIGGWVGPTVALDVCGKERCCHENKYGALVGENGGPKQRTRSGATFIYLNKARIFWYRRSQRPRGLRRGSAAERLLGSWV